MIKLSKIIAPSFYGVYHKVLNEEFTHYWLKGGRGSTKSSFISVMIVLKIMRDANNGIISHALVIRRIKDTLKGSVFEQMVWAINMLGVAHLWHIPEAQLKLTYIPTGQTILFKGADKPEKVKSTKVAKGWIKYLWYEELAEFEGMHKIRTINQSILRGGETYQVFYSYNPPKSARNWVNSEVLKVDKETSLVHSSTYLTVPRTWLGDVFFTEAEILKNNNELAYRNEYLGEATGTGGAIFTNITVRPIEDKEIDTFDKINRGVDFGFTNDPLAYGCNYYDPKKQTLYIFYEFYKIGVTNVRLAEEIKKENKLNRLVYGDSAEPKTIKDLQDMGIKIVGAKKGKDSIHHGIKWLQDLREIIIDPDRCPNATREMTGYEYEIDKDGNFKDNYPDKDNHFIDSLRYSLSDYIGRTKLRIKKQNGLF